VPEHEAKSIGHEETFASDVWDAELLHGHLVRMVDASTTALRTSGLAARTVTVKVRWSDFTMITRSHTLGVPIDTTQAVATVAVALLDSVEVVQGVRLLGVSLSGFGDAGRGVQLAMELDGPTGHGSGSESRVGVEPVGTVRTDDEVERIQDSWVPVTAAVDAIRGRYGGSSVGPASLVGAEGLRVRRRGEAQWGPTTPDRAPDG
jgi:DNA polymerase-4